MDMLTEIIATADQINFDRIRVSLLAAFMALRDAPTLVNQANYWETEDNYTALSQIVPNREWHS